MKSPFRIQMSQVPWAALSTGHGSGEALKQNLENLLTSDDLNESRLAYRNLEGVAVSQGWLYGCAPEVVATIVSALADRVVPEQNIGSVLDVTCLILCGYPAETEVGQGRADISDRCRLEATKGYPEFLRLSIERDRYNAWNIAEEIIEILDDKDG